jgi:caffeoylshikimate esterase
MRTHLVFNLLQIAEELKPHPLVISILKKLTTIIPTWKLVPIEDIVDIGFKDPEKRQKVMNSTVDII